METEAPRHNANVQLLDRIADLIGEAEREIAAGQASIDAAEEWLVEAPNRARKSGIFPAYRRVG